MSLHRIDDTDPLGGGPVSRIAGPQEDRKATRTHLADGTIACPVCDAPVALGGRTVTPADPLRCPYCAHAGVVRDFLSLATPSRPARVRLRVVVQRRLRLRH